MIVFFFCSKVRHNGGDVFMIGLKLEVRGNNWNIIKLAEWEEGGTLKPMQARKRTRETSGVDIFWDGHLAIIRRVQLPRYLRAPILTALQRVNRAAGWMNALFDLALHHSQSLESIPILFERGAFNKFYTSRFHSISRKFQIMSNANQNYLFIEINLKETI